MTQASALLLLGLLALAGSTRAQPHLVQTTIGGQLDNSADDKTLMISVCLQPMLQYFCGLIKIAQADPIVALLMDPTTNATLFAPTDRGCNITRKITLDETGYSLEDLAQDPVQASRFVRAHLVLGSTPLYTSAWRSGQVLYNQLSPQQALTIVEGSHSFGARRQFFIRETLSNLRIDTTRAGFQNLWNIIGGNGYVQVVETPIIPPAGTN